MLRILDAVLRSGGGLAVRRTPRADLSALIRKLCPLRTEMPLVRMGPAGDGGYLVPDDMEGLAACLSPGVDREAGFELDCAQRGMRVFLADASVDGPPARSTAFHFDKLFVGATTGGDTVRVDDWVATMDLPPEADLLLQMDIEGQEYEVLLSVSDALLRRLRIVVVEFHHLNQLWNAAFFPFAAAVFKRLLSTHTCVHIHPNNVADPVTREGVSIPPLMEFTFLRSDRVGNARPATQFPHPLDADNADRPPLALPPCWYGG
jgi:hypothetical protein